MNLGTFFEVFDQFDEAPYAVQSMRTLIIPSATSGKLVQQEVGDQPATSLIDIAEKERSALEESKKIAKQKRLGPMHTEDAPYKIPADWCWTRLGTIGVVFNGNSINADEKKRRFVDVAGRPYIATKDVGYGFQPLVYDNGIYIPESEGNFKVAHANSTLICSEGGSAGKKCGITNRDVCFGNKLYCHETLAGISAKYVLYWYLSPQFLDLFYAVKTGIIGGVSIAKFVELPIPLPPLDEQKRIISKADELISLCDRLEAQQQERDTRHAALARASVARFVDAPTSANLDFLFHKSYKIDPDDLRKSILTIAVQGKLVPQNPNNEPAEELLKRTLSERKELKRTEVTAVRTLSDEEALGYALPESWRWQRLEDLLVFGPTNGISPKAVDYETPVRSLTLSATTSGRFKGEHSKFITTDVPADSDLWLRDGDILVQRGNTIEYVGVAAVYRGEKNRFVYPDLMMKLRVSSTFDVSFIHLALSHQAARDFLRSRASGTSGSMPKINQAALKSLPVPVPPLDEQRRIVTKVDQLMALVDELETQLAASRATAKTLLEALIYELATGSTPCTEVTV